MARRQISAVFTLAVSILLASNSFAEGQPGVLTDSDRSRQLVVDPNRISVPDNMSQSDFGGDTQGRSMTRQRTEYSDGSYVETGGPTRGNGNGTGQQAGGRLSPSDCVGNFSQECNEAFPNGVPGETSQPANDAIVECKSKATTANASCATMSLIGMDPASASMVEMMLPQAMMMISQMNQSPNAADQCKKQADLSKIMGMISTAKGVACAATRGKCSNSCELAEERINERVRILQGMTPQTPATVQEIARLTEQKTEAKKKRQVCDAYQMNVMMAMGQAGSMLSNMVQNNQCAAALSSMTPTPTPFETATPLPLVSGGGDCSDPKVAATSLICLCQSNPNDKLCAGSQAGSLANAGGGSMAGGPGTPGKPFSPDGNVNDDKEIPLVAGQSDGTGSGNRGEGGGGGGGSGFGSSGGSAGGFGGEGDGVGRSGIDKNVITGQSGGGAGGGGMYAPAGGGGGGGRAGGSGGYAGGGSGFDPRKFMPNKRDYKNRGLAGMTVKSTDGITGPMGPSLWEKVTNQYQNQKPKLLPE